MPRELEEVFRYHPPGSQEDVDAYRALRRHGYELAMALEDLVPPSPERDLAIQKVREAIMWGNAGRALGE